MTHWHRASSPFVLFGCETQPKLPLAVGLKLGLAYSWGGFLGAWAGKHVLGASLSFQRFLQTDMLRQRQSVSFAKRSQDACLWTKQETKDRSFWLLGSFIHSFGWISWKNVAKRVKRHREPVTQNATCIWEMPSGPQVVHDAWCQLADHFRWWTLHLPKSTITEPRSLISNRTCKIEPSG